MNRRDVLAAMVVGAALTSAKEAMACSPPPPQPRDTPKDFLKAISQRRYADAMRMIDPKVEMAIMKAEGLKVYVGPKNVIGVLSNLILSEGYLPAGDTKQRAMGGIWDTRGAFSYTDLWKNGKITINAASMCETLKSDGYNLWISGMPVRSIMLLKSNSSYVIEPFSDLTG